MIKNKENKDKVLSFRVPYSIYERYEQACIEEHIKMSDILRAAVERKVIERISEIKKSDALHHQSMIAG